MDVVNAGSFAIRVYSAAKGLPGSSAALYARGVSMGSSSVAGGAAWRGATRQALTLAPGSYWISFESSRTSTFDALLPNYPASPLLDQAFRVGSDPWEPAGTFEPFGVRIGGSAVVALPGDQLEGGALLGRFDAGAMNAAVPESATWVMLIAGFGLVGAGLRRQRAAIG
ncbi:PEPxxWA-CTERM sorting domain-containing protein [Sandaracinobacteroides saxicola]|uniref:PEPxxWA-CTERM sorting domain-containing protein n=2 Tax=Sandaracinobacteroides saxicola TaxID=2759707 RepID=A0A7G5IM67_9SPHN|nr:PEPxxWA-CTERM sorting domain-containing protein [Sandaracinobacteroides saxicola]